jgi:hypothetical protein
MPPHIIYLPFYILSTECADFLLHNGSRVQYLGWDSWTSLGLAIQRENLVVMDALLKEPVGVPVNAPDGQGYSPLYYAVQQGNSFTNTRYI